MTEENMAVEQDYNEAAEEDLQTILKESIKVEKEDIGSLRLKLTITVPEDSLTGERSKQYDDLQREMVVPGFRRGKAPMELVEKRFSTEVSNQLVQSIVSTSYMAAVEKEELDTLGDPLIWCTVKEEKVGDDGANRMVESEKLLAVGEALDVIKLPKGGDYTYSCEVELKPEFEVPELDSIPVEKPNASISDDDVNAELKNMLAMRGTFNPLDESAKVEEDDMVYADMKMIVDGEVIEQEDNTDVPARDHRIKGVPIKDFVKVIEGKKLGDSFEYKTTVPDDHENATIREKEVTFEFKVLEIKRLEIPKIDEELLSSIGLDSEDELRERMKENMEARLESTVQQGMRDQVASYLIDNTEMEIPEGLSQRTTERTIARQMMQMFRAQMPAAEVEKRADQMRVEAEEQTVSQLKLMFILEKIADDLDLDVSEEELNGAIASIAASQNQRFDRMRDELSKNNGIMNLYLQLRDEKVLNNLLEKATITEIEGPKTSEKEKSTETKKTTKKKAAKKKTTAKKTTKKKTTKKAKKSDD